MMGRGQELIKSIFDVDNMFMRGCEKIFNLVMMNLLFVLSCLPLVTIGVAKISLYQSLWQMKHQHRLGVFRSYTRAFVINWKLGLQLGLLELGILLICGLNLWLFSRQSALSFQIIKVLSIGILVFIMLIFLAAYPMAGKYQLNFKQALQNSFMLVSMHFFWFFLMVGILFALVMLLYLSGFTFILGIVAFLFFGFATLAFLQLGILENLFNKYER